MFIRKVKIHNFKCYRDFEITLEEGLNIVVGDNEAGKSTILEAINLALTGIISGKSIWNEISQYIFNKEAVDEYITSLNTAPIELPYISTLSVALFCKLFHVGMVYGMTYKIFMSLIFGVLIVARL